MRSTSVGRAFGLRSWVLLQQTKPRPYLVTLRPGLKGGRPKEEMLAKFKCALREAGATDFSSNPSGGHCSGISASKGFTLKMTSQQLDRFLQNPQHKHLQGNITPFYNDGYDYDAAQPDDSDTDKTAVETETSETDHYDAGYDD